MVARISVGNSLYGVLSYNLEKVEDDVGKVISTNKIRHPEDGNFTIGRCMEDFNRWLPFHFRTEKPIIHISLNSHPDDNLTDEQLATIGEEYLNRLGYGNQPYLIVKHADIEREHIHIVSLRVDSNGKKINDKKEHERSVEITKQLEKEFNLHPAQGNQKEELWQFIPIDLSKGDIKRQMTNVIKPLAKMYQFQTMGEYQALLSLYNIGIEEVKGEKKGKCFHGLVYIPLNEEKEKVGVPFKSSLFGKGFGYDALQEKFQRSQGIIKEKNLRDKTRQTVAEALKVGKNEKRFTEYLKKKGIDVYFRENDSGRITGATFINHNTRTVLNGSRLGKEYSANAFNSLFRENQSGDKKSNQNYQTNGISNSFEPSGSYSNENSSVGGLLSFLPNVASHHPDDHPHLLRKKKRKRRKPGRQL